MNILGKFLAIIGVVIAIVASFVKFDYSSFILVIIGLLIGLFAVKLKDLHNCVLAGLGLALGTTILTHFGVIRAVIGDFLTALFGNILVIVSAGVLAVVVRYLVKYTFSRK